MSDHRLYCCSSPGSFRTAADLNRGLRLLVTLKIRSGCAVVALGMLNELAQIDVR